MWIYIVVVWRGNMYLHNFQLRKQISNKLIILKLFGYYRIDQLLWNCSAVAEYPGYCGIGRYCRIDQLLWNCSAVAEYPGYCGIRRLLQSWLTILELFGCCWIGRLLWNWSAFVKFFGYCLIGRLLWLSIASIPVPDVLNYALWMRISPRMMKLHGTGYL